MGEEAFKKQCVTEPLVLAEQSFEMMYVKGQRKTLGDLVSDLEETLEPFAEGSLKIPLQTGELYKVIVIQKGFFEEKYKEVKPKKWWEVWR